MHLETSFVASRSRDEVVEILFRDDSLVALLPGRSEIIARDGHRKTTSTQYTALGRDGTAPEVRERLAEARGSGIFLRADAAMVAAQMLCKEMLVEHSAEQ